MSEELEWELYDIFASGIFAFPVYEHNQARRIVRYLLMRGVPAEDVAAAIEDHAVDLRSWLERRPGHHMVGEWVMVWLNDSRDQFKTDQRERRLFNRQRRHRDVITATGTRPNGADEDGDDRCHRERRARRRYSKSELDDSSWSLSDDDDDEDYDDVSKTSSESTETDENEVGDVIIGGRLRNSLALPARQRNSTDAQSKSIQTQRRPNHTESDQQNTTEKNQHFENVISKDSSCSSRQAESRGMGSNNGDHRTTSAAVEEPSTSPAVTKVGLKSIGTVIGDLSTSVVRDVTCVPREIRICHSCPHFDKPIAWTTQRPSIPPGWTSRLVLALVGSLKRNLAGNRCSNYATPTRTPPPSDFRSADFSSLASNETDSIAFPVSNDRRDFDGSTSTAEVSGKHAESLTVSDSGHRRWCSCVVTACCGGGLSYEHSCSSSPVLDDERDVEDMPQLSICSGDVIVVQRASDGPVTTSTTDTAVTRRCQPLPVIDNDTIASHVIIEAADYGCTRSTGSQLESCVEFNTEPLAFQRDPETSSRQSFHVTSAVIDRPEVADGRCVRHALPPSPPRGFSSLVV